ncbi:hypothetical protein [Planctomicrobium sp. SH664]|uniref:hypothetical protein n=1 Tax=Planctomicrobium sp. SH664 TaxID=3448125 RepID=UPI003F5B9359
MSQLALLAEVEVDEPRILSFSQFAAPRSRDIIPFHAERARIEHQNRSCAICNRVTVEPIELRNGVLGRNGKMIPGTGTLVGFSCNACGHEWPA